MKLKDALKDIFPLIEQYAPTIARSIGGPFGMAAQYALPLLINVFNPDKPGIDSLIKSMAVDPAAPGKLIEMEEAHKDFLSLFMQNVNTLAKAEINIKLEWQPDSPN